MKMVMVKAPLTLISIGLGSTGSHRVPPNPTWVPRREEQRDREGQKDKGKAGQRDTGKGTRTRWTEGQRKEGQRDKTLHNSNQQQTCTHCALEDKVTVLLVVTVPESLL